MAFLARSGGILRRDLRPVGGCAVPMPDAMVTQTSDPQYQRATEWVGMMTRQAVDGERQHRGRPGADDIAAGERIARVARIVAIGRTFALPLLLATEWRTEDPN